MKTSFNIEKIELDGARKTEILKKIPHMASKKVLVVGDVGLDEYIIGAVKRISPEAPVPVIDVESEEKRLGLSANVAQNITAKPNAINGAALAALLRWTITPALMLDKRNMTDPQIRTDE